MPPPQYPSSSENTADDWQPVSTAPFDRDLELAVIDNGEVHALAFPCCRVLNGWRKSGTQETLSHLLPTHWRAWTED